jgi:hypothetical protein
LKPALVAGASGPKAQAPAEPTEIFLDGAAGPKPRLDGAASGPKPRLDAAEGGPRPQLDGAAGGPKPRAPTDPGRRPAPLRADDPQKPAADSDPAAARAASRRAFIEQTASALGRTWAEGCRRDLHREGRPASGGWPGTLHEARSLVHHALPVEMEGRRMNAINEAERELAVRTAYASARDEWRRHLDPEAP